ncbi:MAG: hypothetical protein ACT4NL_13650 [Pseudomarimonas sp.]
MTAHPETAGELRGKRASLLLWVGAGLLLLVPLLATQFSAEMQWDAADFLVFGTMLAVACGSLQLALRKSRNLAYLSAVGLVVATVFALVWITLAVGIIGDESNRANLLFVGVLVIGASLAITARFQPRGMVRALLVMACAQALVAFVAIGFGWGFKAALVTACLTVPMLLSAALFCSAARQQGLASGSH